MTELSNERLAELISDAMDCTKWDAETWRVVNTVTDHDDHMSTEQALALGNLISRQSHSTGVVNGVGVDMCIAAIRAEHDKPIDGPEHGAWDRGKRDGLRKAISILSALSPEPADGQTVLVTAASLIAIRDALAAENINEAWHQLYSIADPTFCQMEPWRNLEHKAALSPVHKDGEAVAHPDDEAVDRFAAAMKAKLAKKRAEGRGGWENRDEYSAAFLSSLLHGHVIKGDPVDVANLAMMLHQRGESILQTPNSAEKIGPDFVFSMRTHPKEAEVTDSDLLAAMKKHVGWELDWGPEDRHDEESDFGWRVFERSGGRSDLEWTLLGFGESPRAALVAALSRKG